MLGTQSLSNRLNFGSQSVGEKAVGGGGGVELTDTKQAVINNRHRRRPALSGGWVVVTATVNWRC